MEDNRQNDQQGINIPMDDPMRAGVHSLWEQDLFLDYKIKVEDREFRVHKLVMSSMSDYFRAMLTGSMSEGAADSVVIHGVSADVMEILIRYIYTNHMAISKENVTDILGGAVYFQIKSAIKICIHFTLNNVDTETWLDVLALFKLYSLTDAVKDIKSYIRRNITDIVKTDTTKLPYEDFAFLVQNWQNSEYDLFLFIMKWVKADKVERKQHADELLCCVRYSLMTPKQLSEMDIMKNLCDTLNSWDSLIDKSLEYHKLALYQRVLDDSVQSKVRSPPSFVGIGYTEYNEEVGKFYEPFKETFIEHKGLKTPAGMQMPQDCHQIVVNNFLIVCTKTNYHQDYEFCIFDPRTLKWEKMASPMRTMTHTILVHDSKHLYAIGGLQFPTTILDSILQYDFQTNSWSEFDQLPVPLRFPGACIYNNSLYVSGGIPVPGGHILDMESLLQPVNSEDAQKTLYRLNLSSHEWETKAPLLDAEYHHEMHVLKILGEDHLCIIDSVYHMQVYSPAEDRWGMIGFSFNKPLMHFEGRINVRRWVLGNSVYSEHHENYSSRVLGYQKVTIAENDCCPRPYDSIVEDVEYYGGHGVGCEIRTVLAIPPYTSEPEFGCQ